MSQTLDYKGKPMELHVGNFRSHPTCMSLTGKVDGLFGMKKDIILVASLGTNTGYGKSIQMYQGYLDASNRDYDDIVKAIEGSGLATPVLDNDGNPSKKKMGSYNFTLYQFDKNKLQDYDKQGCQKYENNFKSALFIQQTRDAVNERMEQFMNQNSGDYYR